MDKHLKDELEAAYLAGDFRRVLCLMAANPIHLGNVWAFLADFAEYSKDYSPELEYQRMTIDGVPVVVKGAFTLAVVEYLDGTRRCVMRGNDETFKEAVALWQEEKTGKRPF